MVPGTHSPGNLEAALYVELAECRLETKGVSIHAGITMCIELSLA